MIEFKEESSGEAVAAADNKIEKMLPIIQKKILIMQQHLNHLEEMMATKTLTESFYRLIAEYVTESVKLADMSKRLTVDAGMDFQSIIQHSDAAADCRIEYLEENVVRIVFDRLFPHKLPVPGKNTDGITVFQTYVAPLYAAIQRTSPTLYSERVVVVSISHYAAECDMCDYDNQEIAKLIDAIAAGFLKDDGPKYMSQYFDYFLDGFTYSEFFLVPEPYFKDFLEKYIYNSAGKAPML